MRLSSFKHFTLHFEPIKIFLKKERLTNRCIFFILLTFVKSKKNLILNIFGKCKLKLLVSKANKRAKMIFRVLFLCVTGFAAASVQEMRILTTTENMEWYALISLYFKDFVFYSSESTCSVLQLAFLIHWSCQFITILVFEIKIISSTSRSIRDFLPDRS